MKFIRQATAHIVRYFLKEPLINSAAHLAMPFPPCFSCRFFDLPPVNLQNVQERLTKKIIRQLTTSFNQRFLNGNGDLLIVPVWAKSREINAEMHLKTP